MRRIIIAGLAASALAGCTANSVQSASNAPVLEAPQLVTPPQRDPAELQILEWDDPTREVRFREWENWFAGHEVAAATSTRELPAGDSLDPSLDASLRAYMSETNAAGILILQDGKVRFEEYALGFGPDQRWTSFSVAKSFTSTLLGAALHDGFIGSLEDPVTSYIPELEGSSYDGVTVRQIATMTSGVAWNEDYTDPNSDVAQMGRFLFDYGPDAVIEQMKRLEREAPAGEKFVYKSGETNLIGVLVENAVGLPLALYAQTKIVEPAGFAGDLYWMADARGGNVGGCCLSLKLSDYARFGQYVLEGGAGKVPEAWFDEAGAQQVQFGETEFGYGYQWWSYPKGRFGAQGVYGQAVTIVPEKRMVLALVSNWPVASRPRTDWHQLVDEIAEAN